MSKQESKTLSLELLLEVMLYPVLFLMPYAVFREILFFFQRNNPAQRVGLNYQDIGTWITATTIVAAAAVFFPFIVRDLYRHRNRLGGDVFGQLSGADANRKDAEPPAGLTIARCVVPPVLMFLVLAISFSLCFQFLHTNKVFFQPNYTLEVQFVILVGVVYVISSALNLFIIKHYFDGIRTPARPLQRPMMMIITSSLAYSLYYVIFRSLESFRLPQQTMMQISVSLVLVLFVISSTIKGRFEFRKLPFNFPILLLTLLSLFSFFLTPSYMISVKEFLQYLFVVLNFYLLVHCLDPEKNYYDLLTVALVLMAVEAFIGIAQHFGMNALINLGHNFDPFSTLGNKNYVAEMLAMTVPLGLAGSLVAKRVWQKVLAWIAIESILVVVLVAVTRGSWIGVIASSTVFFLFAVDRFPRRKAVEAVISLALLVLSMLVIMALSTNHVIFNPPVISYASRFMSIINIMTDVSMKMPVFWLGYAVLFLFGAGAVRLLLRRNSAKAISIGTIAFIMALIAVLTVAQRDQVTQKQHRAAEIKKGGPTGFVKVEDSITSRKFIWGGTFEMMRQYPLGVGLGAYKIRYLDMLKSYLSRTGINNIPGFFKDVNAKEAHSEYLHIWAEMGPAAPLIFLYFAIVVFSFFIKTFYAENDIRVSIVTLGCMCSLVSIATSATLGFPFHIIGTSMLCGVVLALLVFSRDRKFGVRQLDLYEPGIADPPPGEQRQNGAVSGKKNKKDAKKQNRKKRESEQSAPEEIDKSWRQHWHVIKFHPVLLGVPLIFLSLVFFVVVTYFACRWQMANIEVKAANFLAQQGRIEDARQLYSKSLEHDQYNGDIHLFLGMYYQKLRNFDKAVDEFKEAQKYYDLPQIALDLGAIYFEKGPRYYDEAEEAFRDSLGVFPNYHLPRYNLGLIYYQKAISLIDPGQEPISDIELTGQAKKDKAVSLFESAAEMFKNAMKIDPRLAQASFKLALTYEKLYQLDPENHSMDDAVQWYRRTININPSHADAYYNLGLLLTRKASALNTEADRLNRGSRATEARQFYDQASELMKESGALFDKAIQFNKKHFKALNNRGNQLFNEGKPREALKMYSMALEANPGYVNARMNLALAYMQLNECEQAFPHLEKLRKQRLNPKHLMKIEYMYGSCLDSTGRSPKGYKVLEETYEKYKNTPNNRTVEFGSIVLRMARIDYAFGKREKAIGLLTDFLKVQSPAFQEAEATFLLGIIYQAMGNKEMATQYLSLVKQRYAGSDFAKKATQRLQALK